MEPIKGAARAFKAAIFIFPDISLDQTTECIDGVQEICKPFYVRQGLMLGEFHLRNNSTGLRNQHFYPLRTPVRFFFFCLSLLFTIMDVLVFNIVVIYTNSIENTMNIFSHLFFYSFFLLFFFYFFFCFILKIGTMFSCTSYGPNRSCLS